MGFARQALWTYLIRVVLIPIGAINSVIVARWLGPAGQGLFAAITTWIATAATFAALGLSAAVTSSAAGDAGRAPALLANARLTGILAGGAGVIVLLALHGAVPGLFGGIPLGLLAVAAIALPLNLTSMQFQATALGLGRVRQYNFMEVLDRVLLLGASILLLIVLGGGVSWLVAGTVVIAAAKLALYHGVLWPQAARWRTDLPLLGTLAGFSLRAYVATLLAFLVLRSDIMLVQGLLGSRSTGVYSVAVQVAELMLLLPAAIGTILFPRIASSAAGDRSSAQLTAAVCRHTTVAVTIGCSVVGATAWWLVTLVYGEPYQAATVPLLVLLPGIWCMSLQMILANDLAGRDYPPFLVWTWLVLLTVNVVLNLVWLPRFGIAGAAAASSVAYALALTLLLRYWLRRFPEIRLSGLFVMRAEEWGSLAGRVKEALWPRSNNDASHGP